MALLTVVNHHRRLTLVCVVVFVTLVIYVITGFYKLYTNPPAIEAISFQGIYGKGNVNGTVASLDAHVRLDVAFAKPQSILATPVKASFILSKRVKEQYLVAHSTSQFVLDAGVNQQLVVDFKGKETKLSQAETNLYLQMLQYGVWMDVKGAFKFRLQLARFLPFPWVHWPLYISCDALVKGSVLNDVEYKHCDPATGM